MTEQTSDISGLSRALKFDWNRKQLLGLAPDTITVKATTRLADPARWDQLGQSDTFIWGLYSRPGLSPHKIFVRLADLTGECSCVATKHPCKFLVALLVLFSQEKSREEPLFVSENTPEWVSDTIAVRAAENHHPTPQNTLDIVKVGMAEFGRWLRDQVRQGIANFAERKAADLESMANRLIDWHMLQVANDLRALGQLVAPQKGNPPDDWPEILLKGLGRFYLLVQAWERFDRLNIAEQNDLVHATVFISGRTTLAQQLSLITERATEVVTDQWIVLGRRSEALSRKWVRRTWLYGLESKRFALLEDHVSGRKKLVSNLITGVVYSASFQFEAGTTRFVGRFQPAEVDGGRANLLSTNRLTPRPLPGISHPTDFAKVEKDFTQALTKNPWLRLWPAYLNEVRLQYDQQRNSWLLVDGQGESMLILKGTGSGWYMLAASQGRPVRLFGEWSEEGLSLTSIFHNGVWIDLTVWGSRS